jgi:hypothetical protein
VPALAKPIFRPDVIRLPLLGFRLPEHVARLRPKLEKWAEIIATGSVVAHIVSYPKGKVYVQHVLTHKEYDRGTWKDD